MLRTSSEGKVDKEIIKTKTFLTRVLQLAKKYALQVLTELRNEWIFG